MVLRKAKRSSAKPLIGIYAESGTGKTLSSLYLARGFVGPAGRIAMIETEQGRGEAYADMIPGSYDIERIDADYSPTRYGQAISECERAKVDALIIDSASHEWEGLGGVCDMANTNEANGKKGMLVWQKPKMDHQRHFVGRLLQSPIALIIVCMRAKYPMEQQEIRGKKEWVRSERLSPKQSDDILYEMFVHGWIDHEHKWRSTKVNRDELRQVFVDGQPITIGTGEALAKWAAGDDLPAPAAGDGSIVASVIKHVQAAPDRDALTKLWTEASRMSLAPAGLEQVRIACGKRKAELAGSDSGVSG